MIKEIFIDTETTGVDPQIHGLYEIAGIIRYGDVLEEFEFQCDIFKGDEVDKAAMEKSGVTLADLDSYLDPYDAYLKFNSLLTNHIDKFNKSDKFFLIGFGAEFDAKFLRRWFENNGDKYFGSFFWHPWICVMTIAAQRLMKNRASMSNFRIESVADFLNIPIDNTKQHRALYDARIAMNIYDKLNDPNLTIETPIERRIRETMEKDKEKVEKDPIHPPRPTEKNAKGEPVYRLRKFRN